jgi:hypothetical protein
MGQGVNTKRRNLGRLLLMTYAEILKLSIRSKFHSNFPAARSFTSDASASKKS